MVAPGLRTPRIDMHRCSASTTTITPRGIQLAHQRIRDLRGQPLLHLRPLRVQVDQPGDFRQPGDAAVHTRDVADVGHPVERHQMVLARGVQGDLLHQHEFVVLLVECGVEHRIRVGVEPGEYLPVRPRDPGGGVFQAVPVGILPDGDEQFPDRRLGARLGRTPGW